MLQATLYGLPMTGFDAPRRSVAADDGPATVGTTTPVPTPGPPVPTSASRPADLPVVTTNERRHQDRSSRTTQTFDLTWLKGADGVTIQPGAPALPKQIKDVTVAGQDPARRRFPGAATTPTPTGLSAR